MVTVYDGGSSITDSGAANVTAGAALTAGPLTPPANNGAAPAVTTFVGSAQGLHEPVGLAFDAAGNLYVANSASDSIDKVTPAAVVSTFVALGQGVADPQGVAFDAQGNMYVTNFGNNTIDKVTSAGVISTFVAASQGLAGPGGMAFDSQGDLYVANYSNSTIDKVTPAGAVSTFVAAGQGLDGPQYLAFDSQGNLWVANELSNTLDKVTPAGLVSPLLILGGATLDHPMGLAFDGQGNLYVSNELGNTITRLAAAGTVTTLVNASAGLDNPIGLAFDAQGNLYVANYGNNTVDKITFTQSGPAAEGHAFANQTVFHFTDSDPAATASDFTAVVTLGDGNKVTLSGTSGANGQIVANSGGGFDVQLSYTYAEALANATFGVQVTDTGEATCGASTSNFDVADVPLTATGAVLSATAGASTGTVTVAMFIDGGNPSNTVQSDYSATVNWGDGTSTDTLTSANFAWDPVNNVWDVKDSHAYAKTGSYTITVTVNDGANNSATVTSAATVAGAGLTAGPLTPPCARAPRRRSRPSSRRG